MKFNKHGILIPENEPNIFGLITQLSKIRIKAYNKFKQRIIERYEIQ